MRINFVIWHPLGELAILKVDSVLHSQDNNYYFMVCVSELFYAIKCILLKNSRQIHIVKAYLYSFICASSHFLSIWVLVPVWSSISHQIMGASELLPLNIGCDDRKGKIRDTNGHSEDTMFFFALTAIHFIFRATLCNINRHCEWHIPSIWYSLFCSAALHWSALCILLVW